MNNDEVILKNQELVKENISNINCKNCKYFKNKKCILYIPIIHECLILTRYYNNGR